MVTFLLLCPGLALTVGTATQPVPGGEHHSFTHEVVQSLVPAHFFNAELLCVPRSYWRGCGYNSETKLIGILASFSLNSNRGRQPIHRTNK